MNTNTAEREIRDLLGQWTDAELHADVETLESMLARDFMAVGPLGFIPTRSDWLDRHHSGDLKYEQLSCDETTVRQHGDTALASGVQTQQATYRGNPVPGERFRITLITVRQDGRAVLAGLQLSPIAQPPGRL